MQTNTCPFISKHLFSYHELIGLTPGGCCPQRGARGSPGKTPSPDTGTTVAPGHPLDNLLDILLP